MTESFVLPAPLVVCGPRWKAKRVAGARKKSIVSRRVVAENNVSDLIASQPRAPPLPGAMHARSRRMLREVDVRI